MTAQLTQEVYEDAMMELKHAYRGDKKKRNYAKIKLLESTQPQRKEMDFGEKTTCGIDN